MPSLFAVVRLADNDYDGRAEPVPWWEVVKIPEGESIPYAYFTPYTHSLYRTSKAAFDRCKQDISEATYCSRSLPDGPPITLAQLKQDIADIHSEKWGKDGTEHKRRAAEDERLRATLGSHTPVEWHQKKAEYDFRCADCDLREGEPLPKDGKIMLLTKGHARPVSRGGGHAITNIIPQCMPCNSKQGRSIHRLAP